MLIFQMELFEVVGRATPAGAAGQVSQRRYKCRVGSPAPCKASILQLKSTTKFNKAFYLCKSLELLTKKSIKTKKIQVLILS